MLIVDAHLDLAMNALQWNRDLLASAYTIRAQENYTPGKGRGVGTVAFPEMRRGRIALSFATVIARSTGRPVPHVDFASSAQAHGLGRGQLAYYEGLERQGHVRLIRDASQLDRHMREWASWDGQHQSDGQAPPTALPLGFVLSMEGADPILDPVELEDWWRQGLRIIGLSHYGPGRYAGGTGTEHGVSDIGVRLLVEMARLNIILDLTHCSDEAFWQALEQFPGHVLASHNNARALVPHQRQFSDDQIRAVAARGGVIGAAMDCWMIAPGWRHGDDNRAVTLDLAVKHIDHICQLLGSAHHIGIGSDLDGGYGREGSPYDLDTIADLQKIAALLTQRGYPADDIAAIMHGNWSSLLRSAWGQHEEATKTRTP
jgi:membrane dipeptidase